MRKGPQNPEDRAKGPSCSPLRPGWKEERGLFPDTGSSHFHTIQTLALGDAGLGQSPEMKLEEDYFFSSGWMYPGYKLPLPAIKCHVSPSTISVMVGWPALSSSSFPSSLTSPPSSPERGRLGRGGNEVDRDKRRDKIAHAAGTAHTLLTESVSSCSV